MDTDALERELELKQALDARLSEIANKLECDEDDKFELVNGLVYRKIDDQSRFVVPESMVTNVIRIYHDEMAHCGLEKTIHGIKSTYWFPAMRKKVLDHIENCITCILANSSTHTREGEMQITAGVVKPFEVLHADHFGPLQMTNDGFRYIFIVVDAFTRFTWLFPTKTTNAKEAIIHFGSLFNIFGNPVEIVTDRGTAFTSKEFADFLEPLKIKHRQVAVASPWANGLVERINRFLKSSFKKMLENASEWKALLNKAQYVVNNTYQVAIKNTPAKLLLGFDCRNHEDKALANFVKLLANIDTNLLSERNTDRDIAREASEKLRLYNKKYYDARHTKPTKYQPGDLIMIRDTQHKPGQNPKFKSAYKGPYQISKTLNNNRYVVTDIPGFNVSAKPYNAILSPDKLKPWIKPVTPH